MCLPRLCSCSEYISKIANTLATRAKTCVRRSASYGEPLAGVTLPWAIARGCIHGFELLRGYNGHDGALLADQKSQLLVFCVAEAHARPFEMQARRTVRVLKLAGPFHSDDMVAATATALLDHQSLSGHVGPCTKAASPLVSNWTGGTRRARISSPSLSKQDASVTSLVQSILLAPVNWPLVSASLMRFVVDVGPGQMLDACIAPRLNVQNSNRHLSSVDKDGVRRIICEITGTSFSERDVAFTYTSSEAMRVSAELNEFFDLSLQATITYDFPSVFALTEHVLKCLGDMQRGNACVEGSSSFPSQLLKPPATGIVEAVVGATRPPVHDAIGSKDTRRAELCLLKHPIPSFGAFDPDGQVWT